MTAQSATGPQAGRAADTAGAAASESPTAAAGATAPEGAPAADTAGLDAATAAYLAQARELYAWHCAVCHGATGGGLAEAKLAFPADHRDCTHCHRPGNRAVQPLDRPFKDNDMFSIGDPPALHGAAQRAPLAAVAEPAALQAYIAATMPRYDPGRLADEEYWALTALLLEMNGRRAAAAQVAGDQP